MARLRTAVIISGLAIFFASPVFASRPHLAERLAVCPDSTAVYYITEQEERWVFPDETTYFTWFMDFNDVEQLTCEELTSYAFGGVMTYQPGTNLITLRSTNDVYAVEPEGMLRLIESEEQAIDLYGPLWWTRVRDLDDSFWPAYTIGEPLAEGAIPVGSTLFAFHSDDIASSQYFRWDGAHVRNITNHIDELMNDWTVTTFTVEEIEAMDHESSMSDADWDRLKRLHLKPYVFPGELPADQIADQQMRVVTQRGEIVIELFAETAPLAVSNMVYLAGEDYYRNLIVSRRSEGLSLQFGDTDGQGKHSPDYQFDDELEDDYWHERGMVALANWGANTNGGQFYIMLGDHPELARNHTIFGRVIEGMEVVDVLQKWDVIETIVVEDLGE